MVETLIGHALIPTGLLLVLLFLVPALMGVYASFDSELPAITRLLIALSRPADGYFFLPVILFAGFLVADGLVYRRLLQTDRVIASKLWCVFVVLVELTLAAVVVWALFSPLIGPMTRVSQ